ncbi:MAG: response regulator transcription factor [Armatimonadetes bacterium]|nr:response regulator transcription factor [Armatimonadota bacterium]
MSTPCPKVSSEEYPNSSTRRVRLSWTEPWLMREGAQTRIWIIDDHHIVREGLRSILETEPGFQVVAQSSSASEALTQARDIQCEIILLDFRLRDGRGMECIEALSRQRPDLPILVLTMEDAAELALEAIRSGARGYLAKSVDRHEFLAAVQAVRDGGSYFHAVVADRLLERLRKSKSRSPCLTDRQQQVLQAVATGMSNRQIAGSLGLSLGTVKSDLRSLFLRLGVADRTRLVVEAMHTGLLRDGNGRPEVPC